MGGMGWEAIRKVLPCLCETCLCVEGGAAAICGARAWKVGPMTAHVRAVLMQWVCMDSHVLHRVLWRQDLGRSHTRCTASPRMLHCHW